MGIRVLEGRVFEERDRDGAPTVCIVDETLRGDALARARARSASA